METFKSSGAFSGECPTDSEPGLRNIDLGDKENIEYCTKCIWQWYAPEDAICSKCKSDAGVRSSSDGCYFIPQSRNLNELCVEDNHCISPNTCTFSDSVLKKICSEPERSKGRGHAPPPTQPQHNHKHNHKHNHQDNL